MTGSISRAVRDVGLAPVVRLAPAKVNLTLAIGPRRPDGFHDLHSIMVPLGLADWLSLAPGHGSADSLQVTGDDEPPRPDDLVLRGIAAARAAAEQALGPAADAFPLAARLEKRIPLAAGLAGGSSDAAAAIEGALEAWGIALPGAAHRRGSDRRVGRAVLPRRRTGPRRGPRRAPDAAPCAARWAGRGSRRRPPG